MIRWWRQQLNKFTLRGISGCVTIVSRTLFSHTRFCCKPGQRYRPTLAIYAHIVDKSNCQVRSNFHIGLHTPLQCWSGACVLQSHVSPLYSEAALSKVSGKLYTLTATHAMWQQVTVHPLQPAAAAAQQLSLLPDKHPASALHSAITADAQRQQTMHNRTTVCNSQQSDHAGKTTMMCPSHNAQ